MNSVEEVQLPLPMVNGAEPSGSLTIALVFAGICRVNLKTPLSGVHPEPARPYGVSSVDDRGRGHRSLDVKKLKVISGLYPVGLVGGRGPGETWRCFGDAERCAVMFTSNR